MSATYIHEGSPSHNMWGGVARATAPADRRIPVSAEDLPSERDCLWAVEDDLTPEAARVGAHLVAQAFMGEAIAPIHQLATDCGMTEERALLALDELQTANVITSWADTGGIICAWFDVDADLYYGDDTNPLPEDDADCSDWYYYDRDFADEGVEGPSLFDPNPKRHRIFLKTGYRCFYCVIAIANQIDHMHPRIRGGGNEDANLIGACQPCNVRKKDRTVEEYRAYLAHKNRLPDISHVHFWGEKSN